MKTNSPEELVAYLQELYLADKWLDPELLRPQTPWKTDVQGQYYPTETDIVRYNYALYNLDKGEAWEVVFYTVHTLSFPEIQHAKTALINTASLEKELKAFKWQEQSVLSHPGATLTQAKVMEARENDIARQAAEMLMCKYWKGTPMEKLVPYPLPEIGISKEMSFPVTGQIDDIDLKEAYHLLQGRAVNKPEINSNGHLILPLKGQWLMAENGHLKEYADFDLRGAIEALPQVVQLEKMRNILSKANSGQPIPAFLESDGGRIPGSLWVDPKKAGLKFIDMKGMEHSLFVPAVGRKQNAPKIEHLAKLQAPSKNRKHPGVKR